MENSSARIINNFIDNNDMALDGGGIYIFNGNSVLIENNTIVNNMVFSGYAVSHGAGIYIDSSTCITIAGNIISNNNNVYGDAGGIYVSRSNQIKIINNIVSENYVYGNGGGLYIKSSSNVNITGNLTWNNTAEGIGGGMFFKSSEINLTNNTICYNQSIFEGGTGSGIYCLNSSPEVFNTIIYSNTTALEGNQVFLDANSDPNFFYSNIEGGISAFGLADTVFYNGLYENNIETDPQFMNSAEHSFSLDNDSPCINIGCPDTTGLSIPELDLAGNLRIVNDTIDMGAYENQLITNITHVRKPNHWLVYPNPATDRLNVRFPDNDFQNGWATFYDIKGKAVLTIQLENSLQDYNISSLPQGIYLLKISNGTFIVTEKIIVH
jgi:parallel beta-helix repeat protein